MSTSATTAVSLPVKGVISEFDANSTYCIFAVTDANKAHRVKAIKMVAGMAIVADAGGNLVSIPYPLSASDMPDMGTASAHPSSDFATAAQGTKADSALQPGNTGLLPAGSGWTANTDAGSKTAAVPSTASLTTIATAMDLAISGSGAALLATAEKLKAIQTALAAQTRPNV